MKYGEVWRESLGENFFRYSVIISPDSMNRDLPHVLAVAVVTRSRPWPTRVDIKFKNRKRQVLCEQIYTIDKSKLVEKVESLSIIELAKIRHVLKLMLSQFD